MEKFYKRSVGLALAMLLVATIAFAQTSISGTVKDGTSGETLAGVNIKIKGTVTGTISNTDGQFLLKTSQAPPLKLEFSFVGFSTQEIEVTDANTANLEVTMTESALLGQEVVISASRVSESQLTSPVSIEHMDILAIKNTAATSFYDGLANLKGIDFSSQSLTFKSVNTRGFGSNGNTRFVQLIDGIDNQAPGLNFSVGNIVGINDLDLESVELLPGPSSALYGPNGLQGMLLLRSKSPFEYQGLSMYVKSGVNHVDGRDDDASLYQDYGFRYAKAFNNKWAFKATFSYLRANDFRGVDTRDQSSGVVESGAQERTDERVYDGVNVYGDFKFNLGALPVLSPSQFGPYTNLLPTGSDGDFSPRGFDEKSFVDNTTESIKAGGALHYRINDKLELFGQFNYGSGSTVYTANDRFVLDNFNISTAKLELKGSNFYVRAYTIMENSGDTYAANTVASRINQELYLPVYIQNYIGARALGGLDNESAHTIARNAANADQDARYLPGSELFNRKVDSLRNLSIADGGAKFLDKSSLWHGEATYNFDKITWAKIIAGGNFRQYRLNSEGTLFALEDDGKEITYNEFGGFLQMSKELVDAGINIQASVRYDKNEYFDGQFSPRASIVKNFADKHYLRGSFQRGFRIPTSQDQFIDLDVTTRRLVGSNPLLVNRYFFKTNTVYLTESINDARANGGDISRLIPASQVNDDFQTEKVSTFEVGYRGLFLNGKLMVDVNYFYNDYTDFIAEIDFTQGVPNGIAQDPGAFDADSDAGKEAIVNGTVPTQRFGWDTNVDGHIKAQGWGLQVDYSIYKGYKIGGNVAYNELISEQDLVDQGFTADFNTPPYRYNISLSNRSLTKTVGFNIAYRWQESFYWASAFGNGVIPDFGTLDAQVSFKVPSIKTVIKVGGANILNERYTTSFGNPSMGGIYYVQLNFDQFFN